MANFTIQCAVALSDGYFDIDPNTGVYPQDFMPATKFFTNAYPVAIASGDFNISPITATYPQYFMPATKFFDNAYPMVIANVDELVQVVPRPTVRTAKGSLVVVWKLL